MPPDDLQAPYPMGNHLFPGLWRHLLPEDAQWLKFPTERRASCASCPKAAAGVHHPSTRCCTYFPEVPNFLLGLALQDPGSRSLIEAQINQGCILPTGQQIDAGQYHTAVKSYAQNRFGELTDLVCPFLNPETVQCGIYAYRNSVCSTFFCENDHAESGHQFWEKTQDLVGHIEIALSQAAMQALGVDVCRYMETLDAWAGDIAGSFHPDGGWSLELREQLWGKWLGREVEFLTATAHWVQERRDELYALACGQTLYEARGFESAVRRWLPEAIRSHASPVNPGPVTPVPSPVSELWYKVQLAARQLWEIPFEGGSFRLSPLAMLTTDEVSLESVVRLRRSESSSSESVVPITQAQEILLGMFHQARVFDEKLMDSPEVQATQDAREFFAECLRSGVLVEDVPKACGLPGNQTVSLRKSS